MPTRCKAKAVRDASPLTLPGHDRFSFHDCLPEIAADDPFRTVIKKLSLYFVDVIELPSTFEQLRTTSAGECLRVLVDHLGETCTNPTIVHALLYVELCC